MYERELIELSAAKVRYFVVGGIAVCLHGHVRATVDIDIMLDMNAANVKRFLKSIGKLSYRPRLPVPASAFLDKEQVRSWVEERHLKAFTFVHATDPMLQIDVLLDSPVEFKAGYTRAKRIRINGTIARVACANDLIVMKKSAARRQDKEDILFLQHIVKRKR